MESPSNQGDYWKNVLSSPDQKADTPLSATTALIGVRRITRAHLGLRGVTHTHQVGRTRSLGAKPTSGSAAAPGAAAARPHALPPETRAPAKSSPHTADRTSQGETLPACRHLESLRCHLSLLLWQLTVSRREKDSANRSDTDSRARRRSRSYSPIRKRRRDSPSFMEARRITR